MEENHREILREDRRNLTDLSEGQKIPVILTAATRNPAHHREDLRNPEGLLPEQKILMASPAILIIPKDLSEDLMIVIRTLTGTGMTVTGITQIAGTFHPHRMNLYFNWNIKPSAFSGGLIF